MASNYPPPLIIPPLSLPHRHTFILLHGRGSSGENFGPALLDTPISNGSDSSSPSLTQTPATLATAFPHARFVFPTAARRRATVYRRAYTHQWFDNWKLDPPATAREELQIPGLHETVMYLHNLLRAEIAMVPGGGSNIIFGGLSQGCAASLIALLLWEDEPLGAAVGMCGWLPFQVRLDEQASVPQADGAGDSTSSEEFFDPFERDETDGAVPNPQFRAIRWLRDEINPTTTSSSSSLTYQKVPLYLGHGLQDDRISVTLGREASKCLSKLGSQASWKEYEGLGHWYSGDMLRDMVAFLNERIRAQ